MPQLRRVFRNASGVIGQDERTSQRFLGQSAFKLAKASSVPGRNRANIAHVKVANRNSRPRHFSHERGQKPAAEQNLHGFFPFCGHWSAHAPGTPGATKAVELEQAFQSRRRRPAPLAAARAGRGGGLANAVSAMLWTGGTRSGKPVPDWPFHEPPGFAGLFSVEPCAAKVQALPNAEPAPQVGIGRPLVQAAGQGRA